MLVALSPGQNILELLDERLPSLWVGPAEQLLGFLPRQLAAVQGRADRLATAHQPKALAHPADQAAQGPAGRGVGPFYGGGWPPSAGPRRPPRRVRLRAVGKKGTAAARAAVGDGLGTVGVVGMNPAHHGLGMASGARGQARGAPALRDLKQGERALAGAGVGCIERQGAQILRRLIPTRIVNT